MFWLYKNKQMSGHTNFKTNAHDQAEIDTLKMLVNIPYISIWRTSKYPLALSFDVTIDRAINLH